MTNPVPVTLIDSDKVNQEVLASEVLARLLPDYQALSAAELVQITLDIPAAVATVLGALPEIRALRPDIVTHMPTLDLSQFDKLEDYALALNEAHAAYLVATQPSDEFRALIDEATALRETLLGDATALVRRGLLDSKSLGELKGPVGYKNLSTDLNLLTMALKNKWSSIAGKSAVTAAELDRAAKLQQRLIRLVGLREQGTPAIASATDLRQRAFTCFIRAYDVARRAALNLRWEDGDGDSIAPSLYAGRGGSKRKAAASEIPAPEAPVTPSTPAAGGSPTPGAAPGANAAARDTEPKSDPFLS